MAVYTYLEQIMNKFAFAGVAAVLSAIPASAGAQAFLQAEAGLDSVSIEGFSTEGVAYGVTAGYDVPLSGGIFVGLQGTVADSSTKECVTAGLEEACIRTGRDLAALVRLGTRTGERSSIYLLAGYTNARIRLTYDDGVDSFEIGENGDGVRVGAGGQLDLSDSVFIKAEYRYSNYEADFSRHNALIAVGAKF